MTHSMRTVTAGCGCFTDRAARTQGKCAEHAGNPTSPGYARIGLMVAALALAAGCSTAGAGAQARPFDKVSATQRAEDGSCYVVKQHDNGYQATGWTEGVPCLKRAAR
jgi:hypothetical protein